MRTLDFTIRQKNIKLFLIRRIDFDHINSSAPSTFCIYVMKLEKLKREKYNAA